jgi:hypothetical protein
MGFMVLTQKDLNAIRKLIGLEIDEKLEAKLEEKLKNFPTKADFFSRMDEVMGELKAIREEHTVAAHQLSNHENRITQVENKLGLQSSP